MSPKDPTAVSTYSFSTLPNFFRYLRNAGSYDAQSARLRVLGNTATFATKEGGSFCAQKDTVGNDSHPSSKEENTASLHDTHRGGRGGRKKLYRELISANRKMYTDIHSNL